MADSPGPLAPALVIAGADLDPATICREVNELLGALCHRGAGPADLLGVVRRADPAGLLTDQSLPVVTVTGSEHRWYLCRLAPSVGSGQRAVLAVALGLSPGAIHDFAPTLEPGTEPAEADWLLARLRHGLGGALSRPLSWDRHQCRLQAR
ncbi:MAG: hypothetical protein ACQERG_00725 [Pseudomonadota bacterium]